MWFQQSYVVGAFAPGQCHTHWLCRYPLTDCDRLVFGLPLEVLQHLQGLFLCNGESLTADLFDVGFVDIRHDLLECCAVKPLAEN